MIVYYVVFLISCLFVYAGEKNTGKTKKNTILWLVAVLLPAILAGIRADTVGSDTSGYIKSIHDMCVRNVDWNFVISAYQCELGYYFFNYIITRISDSFQIALFIIQVLILAPVLIACKDNEDLIEPHISYLIFLFLFYNRSLNMCRQSIAISICMFSVRFVRKQEFLKFLLCILLAMSMHRIAIVFLIVYFIFYLLQKKDRVIYKILIISIAVGLLLFYKTIVNKIIGMGYLTTRYLYYVNGGKHNISMVELGIKIIFLLLIIGVKNILGKRNKFNNFLIFLLVLDFLIYCLGFYANYAQRISYYFGFFVIYLVPQVAKCVNKKQRVASMFILFLIVWLFSYVYYGINGCDGTVPYKVAQMI